MNMYLYYSVFAALWFFSEAASDLEPRTLPLVQPDQLRGAIHQSELLKKGQILQDFAYATEGRNRFSGSPGHNSTVNYIFEQLTALDYYDVDIQPFNSTVYNTTLTSSGSRIEAEAMDFTPGGYVEAPIVPLSNFGCNVSDFPANVSGKIVLIEKGGCYYGVQSTNAKAAGAVAMIAYNRRPGMIYGTLVGPGDYSPTVGISQADGKALIAMINSGSTVVANLDLVATNIPTYNVIAQTKGGDGENVLVAGAHTDCSENGPGINDNASGAMGLLEVAIQLSNFSTNNAIRFAFWSAEEQDLRGSGHYIRTLAQAERDKIRLYLNFDMIASANFAYQVFDGDASSANVTGLNVTGPPGSAEAEKLLKDYYKDIVGVSSSPRALDGRSDHESFRFNGFAVGGLTCGSNGNKTEAEAALFGGTAGTQYDPNYETSLDTMDNLNTTAWINVSRGIAHAVATLGRSFDGFPPKKKNNNVQNIQATENHGKLEVGWII